MARTKASSILKSPTQLLPPPTPQRHARIGGYVGRGDLRKGRVPERGQGARQQGVEVFCLNSQCTHGGECSLVSGGQHADDNGDIQGAVIVDRWAAFWV